MRFKHWHEHREKCGQKAAPVMAKDIDILFIEEAQHKEKVK